MRRYLEIISIALISSYITLGILYLINDQIFENIFSQNNSPVSKQTNAQEINNEIYTDIENEINKIKDEIKVLESSLKNIETQTPTNIAGPKGDPGEVPKEYLDKVDQIYVQLSEQQKCLESFFEFYILQGTFFDKRDAEIDTRRNRVYIDIGPKIRNYSYPITEEVLRQQFDC